MEFLDMDEKDPAAVATPDALSPTQLHALAEKRVAIEVADASFGWDAAARPLFDGLNLTVATGELVVVHGAVGEGKSSLCAALLGEMHKRRGSVFVGGAVAYFSQQPWIQHLTVRENILFGKPYDRTKYAAVLEACALTKDLALFPAGDRTEIGQKGVNLSGGQKARIALARACYADADILVLDSPLSAVDAIVQNEIFTKCVLGLLRHKTVLLVTHAPEIIESPFVDRTIELKQGRLLVRVNADKQEAPVLVTPLKARPSVAIDDDLTDATAFSQPSTTVPSFLSPSILSPSMANIFCSPFDDSALQTYDETTLTGTLVFQEERSAGRVSAHVFTAYLAAIGGYPMLAFWALVISLWQVLSIAGDYWLTRWTADPAFEAHAPYHLAVFSALSLGGVVFTIARTTSILCSGLQASRRLFDDMTASLLRAPMRFFDANPVGRILNRYSSDLATVDTQIPMTLNSFLAMVFMAIFCLGTTVVAVGSLGVALVPIVYIYFWVGRHYVHPAREVERVNKVTRSPLLSLISEAIDGALVIRAFGPAHVRRFQRQHQRNVDANLEAVVAGQATLQWFSLRIQLASALLLLVTAVALVWARQELSPGLIGLVLNYTFAVLPFFEWIVTSWSQIETAMVGPERIAEYASLESEAPR
ncbi:ABC transporter-MRP, partial [Achlya hypogyna]